MGGEAKKRQGSGLDRQSEVLFFFTERGDGAQQAKDEHAEFEAFAGGEGGGSFAFFGAAGEQQGGDQAGEGANQGATEQDFAFVCHGLVPPKYGFDAGVQPFKEEDGLYGGIADGAQAGCAAKGVILCQGGVGGQEVEQAGQQVNDAAEEKEEKHSGKEQGEEDPDGGDGRPTANISAGLEGGQADEGDQPQAGQHGKDDRQQDLPQ